MCRAFIQQAAKVDFDLVRQHPIKFWLDKTNQVNYLEWLGRKLNFTSLEDWYTIQKEHFRKYHGTGLLNRYRNSPHQIVVSLFPQHNWKLWQFKHIPTNFWIEADNVKSYMSWLGEKLGYETMDDWYNIKMSSFNENCGGMLISKYNYSPTQIISTVFPEHTWLPWKFVYAPRNLWKDDKMRRKYVAWLGEKLGHTRMQDWYKTKQSDFYQNDGKTLLSYYSYSPRVAITSIFHEHPWETWRFVGKYQTLGTEVGNPSVTSEIRNFVESCLRPLCKVSHLDDWYRVSSEDMERVGKKALVKNSGGLIGMLIRAYPNHVWEWNKFTNLNRKKGQQLMRSVVRNLFPNSQIFEDYIHPSIVYKHNQESIQLDLFLPDLKLAFEYQGPHHYQRETFFENLSEGDLIKKELCENNGLTLIAVPYWWDKSTTSLAFLIHKIRSDLLVDQAGPTIGPILTIGPNPTVGPGK